MNNIQKGKGVAFVRPEINKMRNMWRVIRDCILGEEAIKDKTTQYLPYPSNEYRECDPKLDMRYKVYLQRAVFVNSVGYTLYELLGQVFIKDPTIQVRSDKDIQALVNNATGNGISLIQCAKQSLQYTLAYAYSGILVDFPETNGAISKADYEKNNIRPTITPYSPFEITNFRIEDVGAEEKLSLVVLRENYNEVQSDGFEFKTKRQYRVLRLINGEYVQQLYRSTSDNVQDYKLYSTIKPKDVDGKPFNSIPFYFIGMENNNPYPDNPIMYNLASMNIAHYRNSADYENTMFITGQATLAISGLYKKHEEADNRERRIKLGSEHAIAMENGGTATLLQAKSDSGLHEAMNDKLLMMAKFGAKFLEQNKVVKTAYQVKVENTSQSSILGTCVLNVSNAYENALKMAYRFCGYRDSEDIKFEINTDFEYNRIGSDEQNTVINAWISGAISFAELRMFLNRAKVIEPDTNSAEVLNTIVKERQLLSASNLTNDLKGAKNETETQN